VRPSLTTVVYARHIANRQRADGHWGTAEVNHVDRFQMTPLLHAASIDCGSGAMIELLKFGRQADPDALALAKKYGHTNLLKSLGGK
jgi:hypothetical protein